MKILSSILYLLSIIFALLECDTIVTILSTLASILLIEPEKKVTKTAMVIVYLSFFAFLTIGGYKAYNHITTDYQEIIFTRNNAEQTKLQYVVCTTENGKEYISDKEGKIKIPLENNSSFYIMYNYCFNSNKKIIHKNNHETIHIVISD